MKRIALLILLAMGCINASAQKTKKISIAELQFGSLVGFVHYNTDDEPSDTNYAFIARDDRYPTLYHYETFKTGSIQDMHRLFTKMSNFMATATVDESYKFEGSFFSMASTMGIKYVRLYTTESYSSAFANLNGAQIKKAISAMNAFCVKNKIQLN